MSLLTRFVPRSLRILVAFAPLVAVIAVPVQASQPTLDGPTSQLMRPGVTGSSPTTLPSGDGLSRPLANLDRTSRPLAVSPSEIAVTPLGLSAALTTTSAAWTSLGPRPQTDERCCGSNPKNNVGQASGRVTSLVVDPTNAQTIFAGSAGGGVWKSSNGGTSWTPQTDGQASLAIGALGISANGQTIYAGTGEDNQSDSQYGQGILVSTNGGATWTLTGQSQLAGGHVASIAVDSSNSLHALAATDIGLFSTTNGGATWTQNVQINTQIAFFAPPSGGIFQVVQAPDNASIFWAVAGDVCNSENGDILRSINGGTTWSQVLDVSTVYGGGAASRIAIGVGTSNTVYASLANCGTSTLGDLAAIVKFNGSTWSNIYNSSALGSGGANDYFNLAAAVRDTTIPSSRLIPPTTITLCSVA